MNKAYRAEAREHLKNCVGARFNAEALVIALVGGRIGQSDWSVECDRIISLLDDDDDYRRGFEDGLKANNTVNIARLRSLVRDLYAELIERDECCSSWPVEKYAIRVDGEGIDVSELGVWQVGKDVKLYKQLERQELDRGDKYGELIAQEYRAQYERLIALAHTVGMELKEDE